MSLHKLLHKWKEEKKEEWASGKFTDVHEYGTAILNAKALGNCEAIDRIVNIDLSQLEGELDD